MEGRCRTCLDFSSWQTGDEVKTTGICFSPKWIDSSLHHEKDYDELSSVLFYNGDWVDDNEELDDSASPDIQVGADFGCIHHRKEGD